MTDQCILKLKQAEQIHNNNLEGIEPHKVILFILDKYLRGNYYGTISVKISGDTVQNPKEVEVSYRLENRYNQS